MFQPSKLYLPALAIVAVILILLVFIGFSTYWNLDRARSNALEFVHQQGVTMIEAVEAGMQAVSRETQDESRAFEELINQAAGNESVAYIYLASGQRGDEISSSGYSRARHGFWRPDPEEIKDVASRFRRLADETPVYELARRMIVDGRNAGMLVIGLKMSTFENARQEDFHHAIIMVSILGALGAGAVFFIFIIRRYHMMNQALRRTQEYTSQVVDSMANGLLSIGADGRVLSWNSLGLELLGLSEPDAQNLSLERVLDFEQSGISETLNECRPVMDREIWVSGRFEDSMPLAVSVTPIQSGQSNCEGAVIILRDLRQIKRLEEKVRRSEKLAALGKLSAAVAHEIRNPLSSIRGFARFLSHALKDRPTDAEYADVMVREVDRINRVVTDLLNFARPLELETSDVDPAELVDHTIRLVSADAHSRNVEIRTDIADSPGSANLDANLITQVMLNLVLNSMEAAGPGCFVEIGVGRSAETGDVRFWVEDNGPGIAPQDREKIFDPFFTTREKGTGLGLAIVQKIVENHQGTIRVKSPPVAGKTGCRIEVHIPQPEDEPGTESSI
ncbi:MAG: two-component system sensor histidine kinase NtrB [Thermodesulfobacteriota bacterium]